jgi:hypothetical protein
VLTLLLATLAHASGLEDQLHALEPAFAKVTRAAEARLTAGDHAGGTAVFVDWATQDGSAAAFLSAGNALWRSDPDASFRMHQRAVVLAPEEPVVHGEWALELHRHDRCAEALSSYARAAQGWDRGAPLWALFGHCLLVTGHVDDGLAAIDAAGLKGSHAHVERLFAEVFQDVDPWALRARLLAEARAGSADAWVELIVRDVRFRHDPWTAAYQPRAVDPDWKEARKALAGDPRLPVLAAVVDVRRTTGDPGPILAELQRAWPQELPGPYVLAEQLVIALAEAGVERAHATYGPWLRGRADTGDAGALRLLSAISPAGAGLEALDADGCTRFGLPIFCAGRHVRHVLAGEPLDLAADLARFPEDPRFAALAVLDEARGEALPSHEALLRYLVVEPRWMASSTAWAAAAMLLAAGRHQQMPSFGVDVLEDVLKVELGRPGPECGPWATPEAQAALVCRRVDAAASR